MADAQQRQSPAGRRRNRRVKDGASSVKSTRVASTLSIVDTMGLTQGTKTKQVSGRAHEQLFAAAAARSGLDGSELLEYALAKVALEDDDFAERLLTREGTVDRALDLGI